MDAGADVAAENEPHEGKRKSESAWGIFRLHHQRTRYVYEMFFKKQQISRAVYDFCLREGYADASLIAKWKKVPHPPCLKALHTLVL